MLLYGRTTWTLVKRFEKKFSQNYKRMLHAACCFEQILGAASHKTATVRPLTAHHANHQIKQTAYARYFWKSKDEFISIILQWITPHGDTSIGWPTKTYIHQLSVDTGCCLKDLPREKLIEMDGERVKGILAVGMPR